MSEIEEALVLANRILDRPNADPDDDLAVLSRQLIRVTESRDFYKKYTTTLKKLYELRTKQYRNRCSGEVRDSKLDGELLQILSNLEELEKQPGLTGEPR